MQPVAQPVRPATVHVKRTLREHELVVGDDGDVAPARERKIAAIDRVRMRFAQLRFRIGDVDRARLLFGGKVVPKLQIGKPAGYYNVAAPSKLLRKEWSIVDRIVRFEWPAGERVHDVAGQRDDEDEAQDYVGGRDDRRKSRDRERHD